MHNKCIICDTLLWFPSFDGARFNYCILVLASINAICMHVQSGEKSLLNNLVNITFLYFLMNHSGIFNITVPGYKTASAPEDLKLKVKPKTCASYFK